MFNQLDSQLNIIGVSCFYIDNWRVDTACQNGRALHWACTPWLLVFCMLVVMVVVEGQFVTLLWGGQRHVNVLILVTNPYYVYRNVYSDRGGACYDSIRVTW